MKVSICILLCLHVVCCAVRRQLIPGIPGTGHCDVICDEEIHAETIVCASDGNSYKNKCEFNNAQCKATAGGDTLDYVNFGACVTVDTTCDVVLQSKCLPYGIGLTGTSNGQEALCGSNNRTYDNACEFRTAQCQQQLSSIGTPLTLAHNGKCVMDTSNFLMINCSKYAADNSGLAIEGGSTGLIINSYCAKVYKPICDMKGRTFSNECSFCHFKITTHSITGGNLVTYAAHEGRCTSTDIFG